MYSGRPAKDPQLFLLIVVIKCSYLKQIVQKPRIRYVKKGNRVGWCVSILWIRLCPKYFSYWSGPITNERIQQHWWVYTVWISLYYINYKGTNRGLEPSRGAAAEPTGWCRNYPRRRQHHLAEKIGISWLTCEREQVDRIQWNYVDWPLSTLFVHTF